MRKKSFLIIAIPLLAIVLSSFVFAQTLKMDVTPIKESFKAGENITLKVSVLDFNNNLLNGEVKIILEDAGKRVMIEKTIPSNKLTDIRLNDDSPPGYWKILASYKDSEGKKNEAVGLFMVEENEMAKFELNNDVLTITNTGNTRYIKSIQILIGNSVGTKNVELNIGEKVNFRLIAPQGTYNIRITDGVVFLTKNDVELTGNAIGILDERVTNKNPITGGIGPTDKETPSLSPPGDSKAAWPIYVFLITVFAATILLVIERYYKKKIKG